ncbi:MAG TPA: hypothetical protein VKE24_02160 [Candidatus Acidoferrales bacterium]|nr:hypothetical protein [Candidatus Acidoferrales bacterium]
MSLRLAVALIGLLTVGRLAGCGGESVTNPQFQPQIVNQTDNFSFQATGVTNVTQTLQFTLQNSGTLANITQSSQITAGTAILTIKDAANPSAQVYSANMSIRSNT